jgi:hypothetical protein
VLCDLVGPNAGSRELDHRPAEIVHLRHFGGRPHRELPQAVQLLPERHEGMHDLDQGRSSRSFLHGGRGPNDRAHLHLVDLGIEQP